MQISVLKYVHINSVFIMQHLQTCEMNMVKLFDSTALGKLNVTFQLNIIAFSLFYFAFCQETHYLVYVEFCVWECGIFKFFVNENVVVTKSI